MIISKTPYRISFFGGGTDYPNWFLEKNGQVISTTIDKYIYITCRYLGPFFDHSLRLSYTINETVKEAKDLQHPSGRETLKFLNVKDGLEIHYDGDLPSNSGLGSSSSFTIGLLNAVSSYQGNKLSKKQLALKSIHIEQNLIGETVGSQDQVNISYGGFNHIFFSKKGNFKVKPVSFSLNRKKKFEKNLMMFHTNINRFSTKIANTYVSNISNLSKPLQKIYDSVEISLSILKNGDLDGIGYLMDEIWEQKKQLSRKVSNPFIDSIYNKAKKAGALGGKILGAGGGGFLLLYVPLEKQHEVKRKLSNLIYVPFNFEKEGSKIIYKSRNTKNFQKNKLL